MRKWVPLQPCTFCTLITLSSVQGIVERTEVKQVHRLVQNRSYEATGSCNTFVAEPHEIHFAGFVCGKKHVKSVRIINKTGYLAGMHVIPCDGAIFEASVPCKRGAVAPGMAEVIHIECQPQHEQHYQTVVRIHCGVCYRQFEEFWAHT